LTGEILTRLERAGLKIVGLKMLQADKQTAERHYGSDPDYLRNIGQRTLKTCEDYKLDPLSEIGTSDPLEIGMKVREWNISFLTSGPIIALVLQGPHAVENVRLLIGNTIPMWAAPGTIRRDYTLDSAALANKKSRVARNLIHASGNKAEAEAEIALWFKPSEICEYIRADESAMFE
jgi:nucleoside-diphosphate kinase